MAVQTVQTCPKCAAPAPDLLKDISSQAVVDYFRCSDCGHVWTLPKFHERDSHTQPHDVTVARARQNAS